MIITASVDVTNQIATQVQKELRQEYQLDKLSALTELFDAKVRQELNKAVNVFSGEKGTEEDEIP